MQNPRDDLYNSRWDTRAWTYQEGLLSRRRLVFMDSQTYFQCRAEYHMDGLDCEGVCQEGRPDFEAFPARGIGTNVVDVFTRLTEYYRRVISFDTDIINAFSGVFRAFQDFASDPESPLINHFYGIPMFCQQHGSQADTIRLRQLTSSFIMCLIWYVPIQYADYSGSASCTKVFPSWTWAEIEARQPIDDHEGLFYPSRDNMLESQMNDFVKVHILHRSGERVNLLEYIQHKDEYTSFEPCLEVVSPFIRGTLSEGDEDSFMFLAWPAPYRQNLELQERPESLLGCTLALYLGCTDGFNGFSRLYFPLLKEGLEGEYRRVGLLDVHTKRISMDSLNCIATLQETFGNKDGEWERSVLKLV